MWTKIKTGEAHLFLWAFPVAQAVKNLPAAQETWVQSLGQEDPPEKGKATSPTHTPVFLPGELHGESSLEYAN